MGINYWIHRISHEWEVSYSLLEHGYLSLGWSKFMHDGFTSRVYQHGEQGFNGFMEEKGERSRSRWNLWYFSQFKRNDIIVVPLFDKEFSICKVDGDVIPVSNLSGLEFKNKLGRQTIIDDQGILCLPTEKRYDIGFAVHIEELRRLPRSYADAKLVSRMKIRQANAPINDISESVEAARSANAPVSIHDAISEAAATSFTDIIMRHVSSDDLEHIVRWYMKRKGADNVSIPAKNERKKEKGADADVIAEFSD